MDNKKIEQEIRRCYRILQEDNRIHDDILDFFLNASLEKLKQALNISVSDSYNRKDMEVAFEAGGDWRIACKNLTDGIIDKIEWSENNYDFEEFINNYR